MRTPLFTAVLAIAVVVACGNKTPSKPVGNGSDGATGSATPVEPDTGSGSGSDMTPPPDTGAGSGSGSAMDTGSGSGSGSGAGSGSDTATSGSGDEDTFLAMTKEEKLKVMKTQVVPTMGKAFKAFDAKEYAKFGCKTCHSKASVADGSYKMPNPDLPKLDFAALEAGKQHPKTAEFMAKTVKPEMAKILGLQEYDDDHPKGFGCLHCHTAKK